MSRKKLIKAAIAAPALIIALCTMGLAAAHKEQTLSTTADPRISLKNFEGIVLVRGWERHQVHVAYDVVSPRVDVDVDGIPAKGTAEKIHLVTDSMASNLRSGEKRVDYTMDVPSGATLEITNPQGRVEIHNIGGDTWIRTVGGNITIQGATGEVSVGTIGGAIQILRSSGHVDASSVTGDVTFVGTTSKRIRANSSSGRISYSGNLVPAGDYVLSTYSGDIEILCQPTDSFELHARSAHGKLDNQMEIKPEVHRASPVLYGNGLFGTHNEGRATLDLTSYKGTIHILPQQ